MALFVYIVGIFTSTLIMPQETVISSYYKSKPTYEPQHFTVELQY